VIKVTGDSRLSVALGLHPDVLGYIIDLDPHDFQRLEHPLMRRVMPQRMTLRRVSRLSGVPLSKILLDVHRIAGIDLTETERATLTAASSSDGKPGPASVQPRPDWARDLSEDDVPVMDLRKEEEDQTVMSHEAVAESLRLVGPGEVLLLKCQAEPRSLYAVWERHGHDHFAEQMGHDEWWIFLRKGEARREEAGGG
jgi:hypothetical protein